MTEDVKPLKAFIIYVNREEFDGKVEQLATYIANHKNTVTWWNFIPFLWVITSRSSKREILAQVQDFVGKKTDILVSQIDPKMTDGAVNSGGWEAFTKDITDVVYGTSK